MCSNIISMSLERELEKSQTFTITTRMKMMRLCRPPFVCMAETPPTRGYQPAPATARTHLSAMGSERILFRKSNDL